MINDDRGLMRWCRVDTETSKYLRFLLQQKFPRRHWETQFVGFAIGDRDFNVTRIPTDANSNCKAFVCGQCQWIITSHNSYVGLLG